MNKKLFLAAVTLPALLVGTLTIIGLSKKEELTLKADPVTYTLNCSHLEDDDKIYTTSGYPISMNVNGLCHRDPNYIISFQTTSGGDFSNATPIRGLKTINANFTGRVYFSYGWIDNGVATFTTAFELNKNTTFDFDNYYPSLFRFTQMSGQQFQLNSLELTYSCVNNDDNHSQINHLGFSTGGGSTIMSTDGTIANLDIPATLNSVAITNISNNVFKDSTNLLTVKGGSNIEDIGNNAFSDCPNLTTVDLGDTQITNVYIQTFKDCTSLTKVVLPTTIKLIYSNAFTNTPSSLIIYLKSSDSIPGRQSSSGINSNQLKNYSENEPDEADKANYWHYVNGEPTLWSVQ